MTIKNIKHIVLTAFIIISFCASASAEVITLKSKRTFKGKITEETEKYIKVDLGLDFPITFYRDEIESVTYDDAAPEEKMHPASRSKPRDYRRSEPRTAATTRQEKSFLWEVRSPQTTIFLFGSIHLGKPSMYPLKSTIEDAYAQSSVLVLEVDIANVSPLEVGQQMMSRGMYSDGDRLENHVSKETLAKLNQRARRYGLPKETFSQLKPWMVSMLLAQLQMKELGFDEQYGIDIFFANRAKGRKTIKQLESLEEQINSLDSLPDQGKLLEYSLYSLDETEEMLEVMLNAWGTGDHKMLERIVITEILSEHPELNPIYDKMFYERNYNMTSKIKGYLRSSDIHFVVVGAGHLVGPKGIVALLHKAGYSIRQL